MADYRISADSGNYGRFQKIQQAPSVGCRAKLLRLPPTITTHFTFHRWIKTATMNARITNLIARSQHATVSSARQQWNERHHVRVSMHRVRHSQATDTCRFNLVCNTLLLSHQQQASTQTHTHTHEQWKQTKLTDKWNTTKPNLTQMERRRSQTRDASMQQVLAGQQRHILRAVSGPIIHRNRLTGVTQTSISSSMQIILSIMQSCVLNQSILDSQSTNSDYLLPLHHNIKQHKSYQAVCLKHHKTTYREKNIS